MNKLDGPVCVVANFLGHVNTWGRNTFIHRTLTAEATTWLNIYHHADFKQIYSGSVNSHYKLHFHTMNHSRIKVFFFYYYYGIQKILCQITFKHSDLCIDLSCTFVRNNCHHVDCLYQNIHKRLNDLSINKTLNKCSSLINKNCQTFQLFSSNFIHFRISVVQIKWKDNENDHIVVVYQTAAN